MKKILALLLALTLTFSLAACGGDGDSNADPDTPSGDTATDGPGLDVDVNDGNDTGEGSNSPLDPETIEVGEGVYRDSNVAFEFQDLDYWHRPSDGSEPEKVYTVHFKVSNYTDKPIRIEENYYIFNGCNMIFSIGKGYYHATIAPNSSEICEFMYIDAYLKYAGINCLEDFESLQYSFKYVTCEDEDGEEYDETAFVETPLINISTGNDVEEYYSAETLAGYTKLYDNNGVQMYFIDADRMDEGHGHISLNVLFVNNTDYFLTIQSSKDEGGLVFDDGAAWLSYPFGLVFSQAPHTKLYSRLTTSTNALYREPGIDDVLEFSTLTYYLRAKLYDHYDLHNFENEPLQYDDFSFTVDISDVPLSDELIFPNPIYPNN